MQQAQQDGRVVQLKAVDITEEAFRQFGQVQSGASQPAACVVAPPLVASLQGMAFLPPHQPQNFQERSSLGL